MFQRSSGIIAGINRWSLTDFIPTRKLVQCWSLFFL